MLFASLRQRPDGSIGRKLWDTMVHIMRSCSSFSVESYLLHLVT